MGDFVGRGVWTFEQDGAVREHHLRLAGRGREAAAAAALALLRPLFEANHRWAMAQGEASLVLELARRRADNVDAARAIPPPPGPVTYAGVAVLGGAASSAPARCGWRRGWRSGSEERLGAGRTG